MSNARASGKGLEGGDRIGEKQVDRGLKYEYINEGVLWQEKNFEGESQDMEGINEAIKICYELKLLKTWKYFNTNNYEYKIV